MTSTFRDTRVSLLLPDLVEPSNKKISIVRAHAELSALPSERLKAFLDRPTGKLPSAASGALEACSYLQRLPRDEAQRTLAMLTMAHGGLEVIVATGNESAYVIAPGVLQWPFHPAAPPTVLMHIGRFAIIPALVSGVSLEARMNGADLFFDRADWERHLSPLRRPFDVAADVGRGIVSFHSANGSKVRRCCFLRELETKLPDLPVEIRADVWADKSVVPDDMRLKGRAPKYMEKCDCAKP